MGLSLLWRVKVLFQLIMGYPPVFFVAPSSTFFSLRVPDSSDIGIRVLEERTLNPLCVVDKFSDYIHLTAEETSVQRR